MTTIYEGEHFVQYYTDEPELINNLRRFIGAGLQSGHPSVVIATPQHRQQLESQLSSTGINPVSAAKSGHYIALDADETLSQIMSGSMPDRDRFEEVVGGLMRQLNATEGSVRAYGEMVALLWSRGNEEGAIQLEAYWNDLGKRYNFTLFCAYPVDPEPARHARVKQKTSVAHTSAYGH